MCQVEALHSISRGGSGDCLYLKCHIEPVALADVETVLPCNQVEDVDCNRH